MTKKPKGKKLKTKKSHTDVKDKKRPRKLGLAKFIQPNKPRQGKKESTVDTLEDDTIIRKPTKRIAPTGVKKDQKNLSLLKRCKLQMSSSLLRLMDEKLYQTDSKDVCVDKDNFIAYHSAYDEVSKKWPVQPIDFIAKFIKKRLLTRRESMQKMKFVDVGCGKEPLLKQKLPSKANVQSFDLVSTHKDVVKANMDKLPVADDTIHCAVYSLSLMAKDLGNIILECKRILKVGGSMLIVEVTSRFQGRERKFVTKLEQLGFTLKSTTNLKPNDYFTFFHFKKADRESDYPQSKTCIELKPCVYKSR